MTLSVQSIKSEVCSHEVAKGKCDFLNKPNVICDLCHGIFKEHHSVRVLPCGHGFHQKCAVNMPVKRCPLDNSHFDLVKVHFLGQLLVFGNQSFSLGLLIEKKQEAIRNLIAKTLQKGLSEECAKLIFEALEALIRVINRELLTLNDLHLEVDKIVEKLEPILSQIESFDVENELALDLTRFKSKIIVEGRSKRIFMLDVCQFFYKHNFGEDLDPLMGKILLFIDELTKKIFTLPIYHELAIASDKAFAQKHFKALASLEGSELNKTKYIWNLSREESCRLTRVTNDPKIGHSCSIVAHQICKAGSLRESLKSAAMCVNNYAFSIAWSYSWPIFQAALLPSLSPTTVAVVSSVADVAVVASAAFFAHAIVNHERRCKVHS